jgi:hypothetical protein
MHEYAPLAITLVAIFAGILLKGGPEATEG